jgi:DNA-binding CsgD family transcriptional regulator
MAESGEPLSDREQAVLERLADGLTNREIAQDLDISPNTVKVHVRNVFTKLDVSSRTEATTVAIQRGLLVVPGSTPEPAPEHAPAEPPEPESEVPPPAEAQIEAQPAPSAARPWRVIAFVLILALALLVGAVASAIILDNGGQATPAVTVEPFVSEVLDGTSWRTGRPLPRERSDMAVASIGLDLYVIGGEVEAGVVNLVDIYETDDGFWRTAASKPTAVSDAGAAVLFGEIYVPGGRLADDRPTAVVEAYSPANDAWRPVAPLPSPIAGGLALSDGSRLYLIGGWDGEDFLAGGYVYDPATDAWDSMPPMALGRSDAAGAVIADRLYGVGGYDGRQELDVCQYYSEPDGAWFDCANLDLARAGAGASAQGNDSLYVFGGGRAGGVSHGELYDLEQDSWAQVAMPMLEGDASWHDLGVVSVETDIYALGGRQGDAILSQNFKYTHFTHRTYLPSVGGDG